MVVGGGYGGITVARELDEDFDVVLVEPKDTFVHSVAALRGLVDPQWSGQVFFSYDQLLRRGTVVRGRAASADPHGVTLDDGRRIDADYLVLASGSKYPFPAKMDVDDADAARAKQDAARDELAAAERVLLVGAGPVGIELAGEISDRWPEKSIVVIDSADDILGGRYLPALRATLREQLAARGIDVLLGDPLVAQPPVPVGVREPFAVVTESGASIEADIWFRCYGVDPTSDYLTGELAAARRDDGHIEVDEQLRVRGQEAVFAIGDLTSVPEPKRAAPAERHAEVVAHNIRALASGGDADTSYSPGPEVVLIPLGASGGASQLPGENGEPTVLGRELTAKYKGADLLANRYADKLGLT
ncbi:FAD-dependent oxidoreductase [Epidermidibacterium keratini]|uniref:FAD-dependent oxidoreductase n=1 Tax=Epidermidibacterium keratini TaxID=1891644 RepID=A0A7L4YSJ1_9ACTN|nr:FAD-dependent oxidoreductase [Epidermidibacterium keratini]